MGVCRGRGGCTAWPLQEGRTFACTSLCCRCYYSLQSTFSLYLTGVPKVGRMTPCSNSCCVTKTQSLFRWKAENKFCRLPSCSIHVQSFIQHLATTAAMFPECPHPPLCDLLTGATSLQFENWHEFVKKHENKSYQLPIMTWVKQKQPCMTPHALLTSWKESN